MTDEVVRDGWYQVITVFPESLTTVAYRYESGGWFIPDANFNEASLVGAEITPIYTQAEVDELVGRAQVKADRQSTRDAAIAWAEGEGFKIVQGKFTGSGPFELNSDPREILVEAYLALTLPVVVSDSTNSEYFKRESETMRRYADEHLEDRVILTERMGRALEATKSGDSELATAILSEPFYYFTDDCNEWDELTVEERRVKIAESILHPSPLSDSTALIEEAVQTVAHAIGETFSAPMLADLERWTTREILARKLLTHGEPQLQLKSVVALFAALHPLGVADSTSVTTERPDLSGLEPPKVAPLEGPHHPTNEGDNNQ